MLEVYGKSACVHETGCIRDISSDDRTVGENGEENKNQVSLDSKQRARAKVKGKGPVHAKHRVQGIIYGQVVAAMGGSSERREVSL